MYEAIYFQLKEGIYAAIYEETVILLRVNINDYAGLDLEASKFFQYVLENKFYSKNDSTYGVSNDLSINYSVCKSTLNNYIASFIEQGLIEATIIKERNNKISFPVDTSGMTTREWNKANKDKSLSLLLMIKSIFLLHKTHKLIKHKGMQGIINYLKNNAKNTHLKMPKIYDSILLSHSLDAAHSIYFKNISCLPYASALALLHYSSGFHCDFVIGVQNVPFFAHAWVEVEGQVINDNNELSEKLADILRISSINKVK